MDLFRARAMDTVDFGYYVGHGNPWCITFSSSIDSQRFWFTNARWGGTTGGNSEEEADLEWIALESCNTIQNPAPTGQSAFNRWRQAFKGLHYVLGFHSGAEANF
ncbi:MAG: DUF6345 domain-containing protein [Candidatus Bathyarchaeota archaeon]|nr:DUF6345 domain-containing protein [Candidatus Bathyarchaeota archaeon]MDH5595209.1 DUF6345 domain-containing protein [Candidatus Bathyarchaeota archaeon]